MNCVRIVADGDGNSHFGDVDIALSEVPFAPPAPPLLISEQIEAGQLIFATLPSGWSGDWHPTPARQYFALLRGRLEVEVSDGERREITPGTVVLLEDTFGRGHVTTVLGDTDAEGVFVQLPG